MKRDINEQDRAKIKELLNEAKEKKNATRTETEEFYWRVIDMKIRKWYVRVAERGNKN